jgi:hypothetical protein
MIASLFLLLSIFYIHDTMNVSWNVFGVFIALGVAHKAHDKYKN